MNPELETVELDGGHSIKMSHYQCSAFQDDHSWHFHPECEISYIVKGAGTRFVGDSVEHFSAGDVVLVGPNVPHCWVSEEGETQNEMIVLQFSPLCLGQSFLDMPEAKSLNALLQQAKRGVLISSQQSGVIKSCLDDIESSDGLIRLSHFIRLLHTMSTDDAVTYLASELYIADISEFHGGRLEKVMRYVKENLSQDIKQTEVAEVVCMTPQSFSRFFRATTGRTFVAFVNVLRISEASKLLVNTNHDITEIAFECGYSNVSNFNRRFSEIKKCTPSEYRKRHAVLGKS